ncbi:SDR family oxidoreductase [Paenibacillus sp.]|uniref:SDR family NAD(P)-dependent oxidoreductase n=1 Tax=Paenibacillus sp. TaxID=58172 RepID=UPI002D709F6A|nr:SDR family oxidoreductase [Paenibacillus sp.]HZG56240.1 SDR family oxidoreductase [Paenibacillus sp.]
MKLAGKVAVVTGSGNLRGIGRGIVESLAEDGADIVLHYRSKEAEALQIAEELRLMGRRACAIQADLGQPTQVERFMDEAEAAFGRIDILVNNAGVCYWERVAEITDENFQAMINLNLGATLACSRRAARAMRLRGEGGRIIQISSLQSKRPSLTMGIYSATKAGMDHLTQSMALELAPYGITVNQVLPGWIDTDINLSKPGQQSEEGRRKALETLPLGFQATPRDVGQAVSYLCGESGRAITGAFIKVDAGAFIKCLL